MGRFSFKVQVFKTDIRQFRFSVSPMLVISCIFQGIYSFHLHFYISYYIFHVCKSYTYISFLIPGIGHFYFPSLYLDESYCIKLYQFYQCSPRTNFGL